MLVGIFLGTVAIASAQNQARGPQPELKRLDYFVGNTATEGTMHIGQTTGKFSATDHAEWMPGGFFVVNHSDFSTPFGPGTQLEIMGYDPVKKVYTHESYSSAGIHTSSTGVINGDVWTWTSSDGRARHTVKILSPSQFTFKFELSLDGNTWATIVEGTTTKKD